MKITPVDTQRSAEVRAVVSETRILALDGWRGLSILMVIFGHLLEYRYPAAGGVVLTQLADAISTLGVCIFFVISGLIISKLALREQDSSGHFSVGRFYVRRLLRIVPPFYLYLLFVLLLTATGAIEQHGAQTLEAAFFTCDLPQADCGWFGGHSWSLAYEEQFYLIFPLLFLALGPGIRIVTGMMFLTLVCVPVVRFALHLGHAWFALAHATFYLSFICAGVVASTWRDVTTKLATGPYANCLSVAAVLLLAAVMGLEIASHLHPQAHRYALAHLLLTPTLEPACVVWLVIWSLQGRRVVQRLLDARPIQFLGLISYSLYLWQQLFTATPTYYRGATWLLACPLMIAFAALSYYLIERPCVRLARRFGGQNLPPPVLGSLAPRR